MKSSGDVECKPLLLSILGIFAWGLEEVASSHSNIQENKLIISGRLAVLIVSIAKNFFQ